MPLLSRALALVVMCFCLVPAAASAAYDPFFAAPQTVANMNTVAPAVSGDARAYGVATGDFDKDGDADMFVGRTTGHMAFVRSNGDGTFAAPTVMAWKQTTNNAWAFTAADVNSDSNLDVVWGANTDNPGCSVAGTGCTVTPQVLDGEVRAFLGNGDGTFQESPYFVSGVRHNKGILLSDVGTDAGSVTAGDVDADGDADVVAGSLDGTNSTVKLLRNAGSGAFVTSSIISQPSATSGDGASPTYFPVTTPTTSPWGLATGDADADGDTDLFVGDRALYVYLFENDGTGTFTVKPGNIPNIAARPNVYLRHDPTYRAAVGFTPSLAAGDVDGDGRADVAVGLHSGTQAKNTQVHDGEVVLNVSRGGRHELFGSIGDLGNNVRGLQIADVNGDGARDIVGGEFEGFVKLMRQLPPGDDDGDGISNYVDNAPEHPNAPRIDMNTDGAITHLDQLDNDGDTVLGDPEDESTWQRRGDAADPDDDNDGVADGDDNCRLVSNAGQENGDDDGRGNACDPLDQTDDDGDGLPNGPEEGDPLYSETLAAAKRWSEGDTHFVIRIDALGRLFQNEFTGLMSDAAISSPETWPAKCQGMYNAGDPDPGCATLAGGKEVPVSTVVIPRLLWTDPEVVDWINDRNDNPLFEIGQHGTYHFSNTTGGDWKDLADRNFFSCELCGFDTTESFELLKAGHDTLTGNYDNHWLKQSGATAASPKIDWNASANPLISYAPPFNASDDASREATAWLGLKAFSASVHEEGGGGIGQFFSPDENAFEKFDRYGMFHVSADTELEPPTAPYDPATYREYLESETNDGGLTTWLIEEVEWSGRPCNEADRLADLCNGGSNRENNTVYGPRWDGWMQLLDYVKSYPGGVAMTMGEVALAKSYDNAPTVANADQADGDHDGIGDVIEGAAVEVGGGGLVRNQAGTISATLLNGAGDPIADQAVELRFDADGDGTAETYDATTGDDGVATATVTPTRDVGPAGVSASWDGGRGVTASDTGDVTVRDETGLELTAPAQGQVTDAVSLSAKLTDSDGSPLAGQSVTLSIGSTSATATTDAGGVASASLTLAGPARSDTARAEFAGAGEYGQSSDSAPFSVLKEDTAVTLGAPVTSKGSTTVTATLREADGAGLASRTLAFFAEVRKGKAPATWEPIGSVTTGPAGSATFAVPAKYKGSRLRADFAGDASFLASSATQ